MRGVNDNAGLITGGSYLPSTLAVFLPSLVIIGGYAALLCALVVAGRADGAIARLCMVVLAVASPFLLAHAALRRFTSRVDLMPHAAYLHVGFPSGQPYEVPYGLIHRAFVRTRLVGRLIGGATLVVELVDGRRIAVQCLAEAGVAATALERLVGRERSGGSEPAPMPVVDAGGAGDTFATNF